MCCKENENGLESHCCLKNHKEKIIPCVFAFISMLVAIAGVISIFHCHKSDCQKND